MHITIICFTFLIFYTFAFSSNASWFSLQTKRLQLNESFSLWQVANSITLKNVKNLQKLIRANIHLECIYEKSALSLCRDLRRRASHLDGEFGQGFFVRRNATDPFLPALVSSHHWCSCSHAWHALHTWIARFPTRISSVLSGCARETMPTTCPRPGAGDWIPRAFALLPCDSLSTREVARASSRRAIKAITRMTRSNDSRSFNICPVVLLEILITWYNTLGTVVISHRADNRIFGDWLRN